MKRSYRKKFNKLTPAGKIARFWETFWFYVDVHKMCRRSAYDCAVKDYGFRPPFMETEIEHRLKGEPIEKPELCFPKDGFK